MYEILDSITLYCLNANNAVVVPLCSPQVVVVSAQHHLHHVAYVLAVRRGEIRKGGPLLLGTSASGRAPSGSGNGVRGSSTVKEAAAVGPVP